MKKVLKLVCLTLVFSMLFSLTAFAAEISVEKPEIDVDKKTASVKVNVSDSEDDQQVVILVLANAELGDANIDDDTIAYIDQATAEGTDGEKTYTFSFGISDKFDEVTTFNAYFGGTDVAEAKFQKLRFSVGGPGDCSSEDPNEITDGIVGFPDYNFVISNYYKSTVSDDPIIQARLDAADNDNSGVIDFPDYNAVVSNYTKDYNS